MTVKKAGTYLIFIGLLAANEAIKAFLNPCY